MTMSNHLPFEDLMFAEKPLAIEEEQSLKTHMQDCPACQELAHAWREVEVHLKTAPMVAPRDGFTTRWQARLLDERKKKDHRQTLYLLVFCIGGAVLLLALLAWLTLPALRSPEPLFWASLYRLFTIFSLADTVGKIVVSLFQSLSGAVPLALLILFAGILTELGVLWIVALRLLTNPRRITQ